MILRRSIFAPSIALLVLSTALIGSPAAAQADRGPSTEYLQALDFRSVGPSRGGRVTAVAGVIQEPDVFFLGATGGGVWRTDDRGASWHNVSDGFFSTGSIGAIDIADSDPNVIYVGTGSTGLRSNVITGRGVYGSTDGGENWSFLGLRDAGQIGDVVVDPRDANVVFVAALGNGFRNNEERGVYRSRDGGITWEQVLYLSDAVGFNDLALDTKNPRRIFAAAWKAQRKPWTIESGSADPAEHGLYRSVDGGTEWSRVDLPTGDAAVGKIAVEVSPADPSRVWALVEAEEPARGLYRSDDGGRSFRKINGQTSLTYRPFYYMRMTADPRNRERIYVHNETLWVSSDGGDRFEAMPTPHGDNHAMWIHPEDPELMIQSNDGGANVSLDGGRTWSPQWNQNTAELYQVTVDHDVPYRLYGAQQDNTTISVSSNLRRRLIDPKQDWEEVSGCETGPVVPHPEDLDLVYGGCKGRHAIYDRRTEQTREYWVYPHFNYGHDTREMPYRFQRVAPMIVSPHDPDMLYHGSQHVHRSTNEGRTWVTISPDLTAFEDETQGYSGGPITRDITGEEIYSALYEITESPHEQGVLWVGSNDGPVHVTRDGGANWNRVRIAELPKGARINKIDISPHRPDRAWITAYRYLLGDFEPYVFRADEYGTRVRRLTDGDNGIPVDTPVRVVREDPVREGLLYAGTEFGLYVSFDGGDTWTPLQLDLPVTPITEIRMHRGDLVLSTMGRGFWILDDLAPLRQWSGDVEGRNAALIEPDPTYRVRLAQSRRSAPSDPELEGTGVHLDVWLGRDLDAAQQLELRILDASGDVLRRYESGEAQEPEQAIDGMRPAPRRRAEPVLTRSRGLQRLRWDLRSAGVPTPGARDRTLRGPMVLPSTYAVELALDGELVQSTQIELLPDPRLVDAGITDSELSQQRDALLGLIEDLDQLGTLLERVRDQRELLRDLTMRSDVRLEPGDSAELDAITAELDRLEALLIQPKAGKVGAELEPQLFSQYRYLMGLLDSADQAPGDDAMQRLADLRKELGNITEQADDLFSDRLANFAARLDGLDIPVLEIKP